MRSITIPARKRVALNFLFICLPVIFFSCAGKIESPLVIGYCVNTMPGWLLGESNASVHGVLGYSHFNFKNGGGHTNFLQFGTQMRWSLNRGSLNGPWAGGELTYLIISNKIDNSSTSPHASGFTVGGIAGYRFQLGKFPLSIYAAPGFLHRGGFNTSGMTNSSPASGYYGRLALDIHFMSLLNNKGR